MRLRTYREITACVKRHDGRVVRSCWIAEVKRETGLTRGHAWNRGRGRGAPICPPWAREAIRRFLYDDGKGKPHKEEDV
ncbi:MAG: hypothetical protein OXG44_20230 [Gammaproteobacteria bacterium]|nr:hypothetical protein [Gammaproteobacteria bacterium]